MGTTEKPQFRRHMHELRQAAGAMGHDVRLEGREAEEVLKDLPEETARAAENLAYDVADEAEIAGRVIRQDLAKVPGEVRHGIDVAEEDVTRAAGAARDEIEDVEFRTKEATKNSLARAAGVKRKPMRRWGQS